MVSDNQRVSSAFRQRLDAGIAATEASVEYFRTVLIDKAPFDIVHSVVVFQQAKINFLPGGGTQYINILRSRAFDHTCARALDSGSDFIADLDAKLARRGDVE